MLLTAIITEILKTFSLNNRIIKTVLGPEQAEGFCYDACSYEIKWLFTKDKNFLIRLAGGFSPVKIGVLNIKTLKSFELDDDYEFNLDKVVFSDDNKRMSFEGTKSGSKEQTSSEITVYLDEGRTTIR